MLVLVGAAVVSGLCGLRLWTAVWAPVLSMRAVVLAIAAVRLSGTKSPSSRSSVTTNDSSVLNLRVIFMMDLSPATPVVKPAISMAPAHP